jgi:hypothetical protein
MKKYSMIATALLVLTGNLAYAAMEDLTITAGAVSWYSRYNPISRIQGIDTPHSTYAFMNGPTFTAQYNNMYLKATYLLSSNAYNTISADTVIKAHHANANSEATRQDFDLVFGYMLTPLLSLTAGYKGIYVDDAVTLVSQGVATTARRTQAYHVGTLGVGAQVPVGQRIVWLTNGNAILGSFHNEVAYPASYRRLNEPDYNAPAWGGDVDTKVVYTIATHVSVNIGLKCQYIKSGSDNSSFFGPTLGLDCKF